jgi:hypothetical protein
MHQGLDLSGSALQLGELKIRPAADAEHTDVHVAVPVADLELARVVLDAGPDSRHVLLRCASGMSVHKRGTTNYFEHAERTYQCQATTEPQVSPMVRRRRALICTQLCVACNKVASLLHPAYLLTP